MTVLSQRGLFQQDWWRWVGIAVLLGFALVFNALVLLAQTFLNRELSLTIPVKSGLQLSTAYGPLACDDIASCSHSACDDILCLGCLASDDIISLGPVAWDNTISSVPMVRCEIFLRMADPAHASLATLKWTCTEDFICCSDWECGSCCSRGGSGREGVHAHRQQQAEHSQNAPDTQKDHQRRVHDPSL